jgi:hypothetical protein
MVEVGAFQEVCKAFSQRSLLVQSIGDFPVCVGRLHVFTSNEGPIRPTFFFTVYCGFLFHPALFHRALQPLCP